MYKSEHTLPLPSLKVDRVLPTIQPSSFNRQQLTTIKSVINATPLSQFALDRNACYIAFNRVHAERIKAFFSVEIREGLNALEIYPEEDFKAAYAGFYKAINGETVSIFQQVLSPNNDQLQFEQIISPLNDEHGNITGVLFTTVSLTEREKANSNFKNAEKRFRSIFENSPDGIFIEDRFGTILDVNQAGCELQAISADKLIGKNITALVPRAMQRKIMRDFYSLFYNTLPFVESYIWNAEGKMIPVEITGKRIVYGEKEAIIIMVRDITERKKLQNAWEQLLLERNRQEADMFKETLRVRKEERERIALDLHDEVGGSLSKISILCQVIKKNHPQLGQASTELDKIIDSTRMIQQNLNSIVWSMNPKNDTLENLISYIKYTIADFTDSFDISYNVILPPVIPSHIINGTVRHHIFLVVKESVHNVLKHSGAEAFVVSISIENDILKISIADNGKGYSSDCLKKFGNGLSSMKERMHSIHGKFFIESSPGNGCKVMLEYPLQDPDFIGPRAS